MEFPDVRTHLIIPGFNLEGPKIVWLMESPAIKHQALYQWQRYQGRIQAALYFQDCRQVRLR